MFRDVNLYSSLKVTVVNWLNRLQGFVISLGFLVVERTLGWFKLHPESAGTLKGVLQGLPHVFESQ